MLIPGPQLIQLANPMKYACINETQALTVAGGTFTSGANRLRNLNTIQADTDGIILDLSSNRFTIGPGRYAIHVQAPSYRVASNQVYLRNGSIATYLMYGQSAYADPAAGGCLAVLSGQFSVASTSVMEVYHRCGTTQADNGFGVAADLFGFEVYTIVELWKFPS